jgi:hypothetical protein
MLAAKGISLDDIVGKAEAGNWSKSTDTILTTEKLASTA